MNGYLDYDTIGKMLDCAYFESKTLEQIHAYCYNQLHLAKLHDEASLENDKRMWENIMPSPMIPVIPKPI